MNARRRLTFLAAAGLSIGAVAMSSSPAVAGAAIQIYVHISQYSPSPTTITLDVEDSDSIDNVKQKIQDHTGLIPPEMCLVSDGTQLQNDTILSDGNVHAGDTLELYKVPVVAAWSITPDEPYLGGIVSNVPVTHPAPVHASVSDGSIPAGVSLDENTGTVDGTFTEVGPFDVTIQVDTICGSAALNWSGTVYDRLPDTGQSDRVIGGSLAVGTALVTAGAILVVTRRRRAS